MIPPDALNKKRYKKCQKIYLNDKNILYYLVLIFFNIPSYYKQFV